MLSLGNEFRGDFHFLHVYTWELMLFKMSTYFFHNQKHIFLLKSECRTIYVACYRLRYRENEFLNVYLLGYT